MWIFNGKRSCSSYSTSHGLLAMGKVDQLHPDLAVDPLGILRPLSKLTHQLPLVQLGYHGSYQLVSFFSPSWLWLWTEDLHVHRSVHTHLLRGWLVLVMIWITSEGGWTPRQMSHCSQIAQGISLVPSITYFTQVCAWLLITAYVGFLLYCCSLYSRYCGRTGWWRPCLLSSFSGFIDSGVVIGTSGWGKLKKRHSSPFTWVVIRSHCALGRVPVQA